MQDQLLARWQQWDALVSSAVFDSLKAVGFGSLSGPPSKITKDLPFADSPTPAVTTIGVYLVVVTLGAAFLRLRKQPTSKTPDPGWLRFLVQVSGIAALIAVSARQAGPGAISAFDTWGGGRMHRTLAIAIAMRLATVHRTCSIQTAKVDSGVLGRLHVAGPFQEALIRFEQCCKEVHSMRVSSIVRPSDHQIASGRHQLRQWCGDEDMQCDLPKPLEASAFEACGGCSICNTSALRTNLVRRFRIHTRSRAAKGQSFGAGGGNQSS